MVPAWKLAWHQGYSYRVKSCSLVHVSSITYKMSQQALNQQVRLYSPVTNDPVVQELLPPRDVSALTALHAVPCVWPADRRCWCSYCLFSCLSLLRVCPHCSHSEPVMLFPAEKASSLCNGTVRISVSITLARLGLC